MSNVRIYFIGTPGNNVRLVRSNNRQQALSHVANSLFVIRKATQDDIVEAVSAGIAVENYRDPDQTEIPLEN
jgi:hypothetical protein